VACEQAGICVTLPKPMTSGAKSDGRFGKQDFVYMLEEDVYRCPAGEKTHRKKSPLVTRWQDFESRYICDS
jgi:hypothetical protein